MEIMIAALILALSVVATLGVVGTSRANMLREEVRWRKAHLLGNVAEYYLMAGADAALLEGVLPEGYSADCSLEDATELADLPEEAAESINGWRLGEYLIRVFGPDGESIAEATIRKILKEDDLGYTTLGAGNAN